MSIVAISNSSDINTAITESFNALGDLASLFENKHVAIKPNDTWAAMSDKTACTQADSVEAVIQRVKRYKPKKITVTGGSGDGQTDEIFSILGIDKVIKAEAVEFFDHNKGPFERVKLDYGPQNEIMVNPYIFSYDTLLSLAQLKVHRSATVTLSMKNIALSYPAADYYGHPRELFLHSHNFFKDLHGFIAGVCQRFSISLAVLTGHPAMVDKGPIGGHAFEADLVVASRDFVAADTIGAKILGYDQVKHIEQAAQLGLGTMDVNKISIAGISLEKAVEIFNARKNERYIGVF